MSNETSGNGGKIIIGLLAIALIGSWIYFSSSKTEIITNYTTQVNNLDSAKNAIQADFIAVSAKADSLTQQNTQLQGDLLSKSNDIQQLKSNISNILRKKEATDKELAEAKSMIADLNGKVAGLFTDLAKAQEENKALTVKNEVLTTENTNLNTNLTSTTKEKERLQDLGSTLHASSFSIQAVRVKDDGTEKVTKSAKRANTIRLSFQIDKNKITPSGTQDLYVCITAPNGVSFTEGGKINTREDGTKAYSNKIAVQYVQNAVLPISYDVKQSAKFVEGEYLVEVYNNGFKIGEGKTTLKKGGLF
jgi:myosin heavy subunit